MNNEYRTRIERLLARPLTTKNFLLVVPRDINILIVSFVIWWVVCFTTITADLIMSFYLASVPTSLCGLAISLINTVKGPDCFDHLFTDIRSGVFLYRFVTAVRFNTQPHDKSPKPKGVSHATNL